MWVSKDYALLLILATLWSGSFAFIKVGVESVGPMTLTSARLGIAAVILYAWLRIRGYRLPRDARSWGVFVFIGLVGNALPFTLISWGEIHIDSGLAAVLMGVMPVTTAMLAHSFIREEPFTLRIGLGITLGFASIAVLLGPDALAGLTASILAQLAILLSAICYGASATFIRYFAEPANWPSLASGALFAAFIWSLPATLILETPWALQPEPQAIMAMFYLGIGSTAVANLIFFYLIPRLGANRSAQVNYFVPILGALWGVIFLKEQLSLRLLLALTLILIAVAVIQPRKGTPERSDNTGSGE
ncbi:MAG: DMT family transporter [Arenicellales bacterium]|nr:DMT family transporter [Arenicellales bacterium]MDP6918734.1 DMT family transporter [Arenicellales bacterium]